MTMPMLRMVPEKEMQMENKEAWIVAEMEAQTDHDLDRLGLCCMLDFALNLGRMATVAKQGDWVHQMETG